MSMDECYICGHITTNPSGLCDLCEDDVCVTEDLYEEGWYDLDDYDFGDEYDSGEEDD